MQITNIKHSRVKSPETQELLNNLQEFGVQLVRNPLLKGVMFKDITISTIRTVFNHGLGSPYTGYIVVERDTDGIIYTDSTASNDRAVAIALKASKSTVCTIWVF
jgi:hypothetical protein